MNAPTLPPVLEDSSQGIELSLSITDASLTDALLPTIEAMDSVHLDHDPERRVGSIRPDLLTRSGGLVAKTRKPIDIHAFSYSDTGVGLLNPRSRLRVRYIYVHVFQGDLISLSGFKRLRSLNEIDPRIQPAIAATDLLGDKLVADNLDFEWVRRILLVTPSTRMETGMRQEMISDALRTIEDHAHQIRVTVDRGIDESLLEAILSPSVDCAVIGGRVTRSTTPDAAIDRLRLAIPEVKHRDQT